MEYVSPIKPICEHSSASYREKMSWEIKEDWKENMLRMQLKTDIPGTQHNSPGGTLFIDNQGIAFKTDWPEDLDLDLVCVNTEFKVKTSDGKCTVDIKGGRTVREVDKYPELGFKCEFFLDL